MTLCLRAFFLGSPRLIPGVAPFVRPTIGVFALYEPSFLEWMGGEGGLPPRPPGLASHKQPSYVCMIILQQTGIPHTEKLSAPTHSWGSGVLAGANRLRAAAKSNPAPQSKKIEKCFSLKQY
jgi:hypothetical protein